MTTTQDGLTRRVAAYAAGLPAESISPEVADRTKQLLLDFLGVALGGRALSPLSGPLLEGVRALSAGSSGRASVAGEHATYAPHFAALLNAAFAHAMDFDDTHRDAIMHQGTPLFAALLAAGETRGVSGADLLTAAVAGYEVGGKLGLAHGDRVHLRGFHPTATTGIFAVTAAAARLAGLDEAATEDALGIALGMTSGSQQFTDGGGSLKPLQVGMAAHNALYAAGLAQAGVPGTRRPLEGLFGYYATYAQPGSDLDMVVLDEPQEVLKVAVKPYPCCRYSHSTIDGMLSLVREQGLQPDDIESVDVTLPPAGYHLVGAQPDFKRRPATIVDAQFSVYFAAAAAACNGDYSWDSYQQLADSRLRDVMDRISVRPSEDLGGMSSRLRVVSSRGDWALDLPYPRGEPELPLGWPDIEAKFHDLATRVLSESAAAELTEMVHRLESLDDVGRLTALLRPSAPGS